jgi:type II secretory pathway component GspD/PulD (secretin)
LRFVSPRKDGTASFVESGLLEGIQIISDPRTNSLIVIAPEKSMPLVLSLIRGLDIPPSARAEINIFPLKKADASAVAGTIQQLFLGSSTFGPANVSGVPGVPTGGGVPGGTTGGVPGGALGTGVRPLVPIGLTGQPVEGVPLIDLRIGVDLRTNSVIVAGSRNDLDVIEAIVTRLEDTDVLPRRNEVYRLQNSTAIDVANALNTFLTNTLAVISRGSQLTPFQDIEREVVVVPEPITNKLLISATPRYYPDIMRMIHELDAELPQVVIQVLLAEVDLNNSDEFGVEIGLQSPVLFHRSVVPDPAYLGGGNISYMNAAPATGGVPLGFQVLPGASVSSTINPTANPGFNFNTPGTVPLGNNPVVSPATVGFQGVTSLGVGRASTIVPGSPSGFVFSASSDYFNLLIRALAAQERVDVLSRPQIMTLDNQAASVQVGQSVPYTASTGVAAGTATTAVNYLNIGILLNVIPKICPDGKVIMRVTPTVSALAPAFNTAGVNAPAIATQTLDTTVIAHDGETVVLGGLMRRSDTKNENKVPWFGDLPYLGTLFRYRTQAKAKQELLVIMTPHIVRNRAEADRILAEEGRRMDWILGDVIKTQGSSGMAPLFPTPPSVPPMPGLSAQPGAVDGALARPIVPIPVPQKSAPQELPAPRPNGPDVLPPPRPAPAKPAETRPAETKPQAASQGPASGAAEVPPEQRPLAGLSVSGTPATVTTLPSPAGSPASTDAGGPVNLAPAMPVPDDALPAAPASDQGKESRRWRLFRRD